MQIDPMILSKHLHQAAIEQLAETLGREGYSIEREPQIGKVPQAQPDLVARRGDETIVYEVKVVGDNSRRDIESITRAARTLNAQFRLVVVRPQRETAITVDGSEHLILRAAQSQPSVEELRRRLAREVHIVAITDVMLDAVSVSRDEIELLGSAVAEVTFQHPAGMPCEVDDSVPFAFTVWFDGERHLTRPAHIIWDTSDWDDLVDA